MTIESNKTFGYIGALLTLIGVISTLTSIYAVISGESSASLVFVGIGGIIGLVSFVGFILFLVAMYGFSRDYAEHRIFRYIIYGFIGAIITAVVVMTTWSILTFVNILSQNMLSSLTNSSDIQSLLAPYLSPLMPVMSVVSLIWIYFNYKSYNLLAAKSEVSLFRTAAKIFVLGAVINIGVAVVFAILAYNGSVSITSMELVSVPGALIQYVAWAFMAKGFSTIKAPIAPAVAAPAYTTPVTGSAERFCPNCGTPTQPGDTFCVKCGTKLK